MMAIWFFQFWNIYFACLEKTVCLTQTQQYSFGLFKNMILYTLLFGLLSVVVRFPHAIIVDWMWIGCGVKKNVSPDNKSNVLKTSWEPRHQQLAVGAHHHHLRYFGNDGDGHFWSPLLLATCAGLGWHQDGWVSITISIKHYSESVAMVGCIVVIRIYQA